MDISDSIKACDSDFDKEKFLKWWNRLITLEQPDNRREICNGFLSSIGNNHAGSYNPFVVMRVLPALFVLGENDSCSVFCVELVYEIMVDLFFFDAECGSSEKERLSLENQVRNMIFGFSKKSRPFQDYLGRVDISFDEYETTD